MGYTEAFFSLAIAFIAGFFSSFFSERGKNQALLKDIEQLTKEKEKVIHEFQLDLVKRKHQYESKTAQFHKYFNFLDELTTDAIKIGFEKIQPVMALFYLKSKEAGDDNEKQASAISDMSYALSDIVMEMGRSFLKIKYETNGMRLISNETTRHLLTELETIYQDQFNYSADFLRKFPEMIAANQNEKIEASQVIVNKFAENAVLIKNKLMDQVRNELSEI